MSSKISVNNLKINLDISGRLSEVVKANRLNRKEVAKKINISVQYLGDMFNGNNPITMNLLECLSREYGISIDWIIRGDERRKEFRRASDSPKNRNKAVYKFDRRKDGLRL